MLGRSSKLRVGAVITLAQIVCVAADAAPATVVAKETSQPVTSISRELLERLPVGRRVEDLIKTCPGQTIPTVSREPSTFIDGKPLEPALSLECLRPADIEMIEVYTAHNAARAEYGAPPLAWDPGLVTGEAGAAAYVQVLARTGKMVHAPRAGRGNVRENISQGMPWWSTQQLLGNWTKEKAKFKPGKFPAVSTTHNWYDVGHWAQMIWIKTVVIGCAKAAGIGASWLVCRYGPGGNKDGEWVGVPVDDKATALASNTEIRPRLIGGDYSGGNKDGKPVGMSPEQIVNSVPLSIYNVSTATMYTQGASMWPEKKGGKPVIAENLDPPADSITWRFLPEASIYPDALRNNEVDFIYPQPELASVGDDQLTWGVDSDVVDKYIWRGFVLGDDVILQPNMWISAYGFTADVWSQLTSEIEGSNLNDDTTVEQPNLPKSEVFNTNQPITNSKADELFRRHYEAVMKMADGTPYEQRVSALMAGWYLYSTGKFRCDSAKMVAGEGQVRAALEALKQMKANMAEVGEFSAVDQEELTTTIEDYEYLLNYDKPKSATPAAGLPADPAAPELPSTEVFNPADWPKCPLDVM